MAKKQIKIDNTNSVYSYMKINKTLKSSFLIFISVIFLLIASGIFSGIINHLHWTVIGLSSSMLGILLSLYPETETWVYKPWQGQANKIEHHDEY